MELFGTGGFSFYFAYTLVGFFWLFASLPSHYDGLTRLIVQAFVFVGVPLAFLAMHLLRKRLSQNSRHIHLMPLFLLLGMVLPVLVLVSHFGINIHLSVYAAAALATGLAGGYFTLRWLDGCGSARVHKHLRFTSAGVIGGALLFLLVNLVAAAAQPVFAIIYLVASCLILVFLQTRTERGTEVVIKSRKQLLPFTREVEPTIFVYGIVFGLGFALMSWFGGQLVLFGLAAVLLGGVAVFVLDTIGVRINIANTQRVLLVVTVAACLLLPFDHQLFRIIGVVLITASWAAFNAINWANLVRHSVSQKALVFFSIASGASVSTLGFLGGWLLALAYACLNLSQTFLIAIMLALVFTLVLVVMLFYPQQQHHKDANVAAAQPEPIAMSEDELGDKALFSIRCEKVSELYGLSPRERDVLVYLARGRNANHIQKELCVSPHTAKSHIYNIYRKLNIHSQQKLMDFVEEYPIDVKGRP
jgi:DNA-binding CsgD family transcriptional regulator